jgi:oxygen-independent coproporphyrinogen-3 oxidase
MSTGCSWSQREPTLVKEWDKTVLFAMHEPLGIYISVPFCKAKCTFCNFASDAFGSERLQSYVERLNAEIRGASQAAERLGAELPRSVDTVYFGGGTPSLLSASQVTAIFETLRGEFDIADDAEITLECAPGQIADATLEEMLRQGMNRVSLGVQSFVDKETASVGRLHTRDICEAELARLRAAGVNDINVDLIAGLPHQTEQSWRYSVERAIANGAPHVSVYMLEVDEDSRLGREVLAHGGRYSASVVPGEDTVAEWYQMACEQLAAADVRQYEISNFARAEYKSRHNLKYWKRQPYIGFGLDAHSMLLTSTGAVRFANTDDLDKYLAEAASANPLSLLPEAGSTRDAEPVFLGETEAFEESLFLGLRLNEGVRLETLRAEFGDEIVDAVMPAAHDAHDAGLLELKDDAMRLTAEGRMASNEVFSRMLVPASV